jgi:uncharacterized membrane protein
MGIGRKIYWIPLLLVGLTALLWPCSILAQVEKMPYLSLNIVGDDYYNVITAGQEKTIFLEVGNNGSRELTNIRLSAEAPKDLTVEFSPEVIENLEPGNSQVVDVVLRPASDATKREYTVALLAQSNETSQLADIRVKVQSSSLFWVWVGAGIGALLIAGFVFIFMRFGREEP